jgi:hypothetical protein
MMKRAITINNIPAIMWGDDSDRGIIAIHGNQSTKPFYVLLRQGRTIYKYIL